MSARILLIEDEPEIAGFILRGLREEGYTVEHESNGVDGLAALTQQVWDAVILDWRLPGQDGLAVLKEYRQRDRQTPVLFLTARDSVLDRVTGLNGGADDYLCKPFAFVELLARIRALLRREDRRPGVVLTYSDVSVDMVTRQSTRGGQRLDLTAREEALLAFFLRHPEQVLTRTRIYEAVWDERYDGMSNTLEVHVMELRKKLERYGPRLIHTLRGRGYRLGESE
ncbi:response regulator transcription factor [Planctellipticum variicoloris]|uniref:response regulator transcription factor n=1 Tax=Planctellipticum variicoloris TaxID=3064265 RepID=UPI00301324FC|nr:response regulator transcription factor [Planctomycetaceae bacterium SH412]